MEDREAKREEEDKEQEGRGQQKLGGRGTDSVTTSRQSALISSLYTFQTSDSRQ